MATDQEWMDIIANILGGSGDSGSLLWEKVQRDHPDWKDDTKGYMRFLYKEFNNERCFNVGACGCGECVLKTLEELE